jgi:hypothetical protein
MKWKHAIVGLAAAWLAVVVPTEAALAFDCTGSGTYNPSGTIHVSCAGSCTSGTCSEQTGTDAQGTFKFCGCNSTDFDDCCTVVIRMSGTVGTPKKYGSCPACPAAGACNLCGTDNQPVCGQCPVF